MGGGGDSGGVDWGDSSGDTGGINWGDSGNNGITVGESGDSGGIDWGDGGGDSGGIDWGDTGISVEDSSAPVITLEESGEGKCKTVLALQYFHSVED